MTKEEAKIIILNFFRDTSKKGMDAFVLSKEYLEAEQVLGGRLSPEMTALYDKAINDE